MKQKIRLTKSEREIMDILWGQQEALTSSEIIKASPNKSWGNTSILELFLLMLHIHRSALLSSRVLPESMLL